jgi:crotonobetainyl-CoA:carnitine CoA-transferase CaiB-like acyl-CoA transferase
MTDVMKGVRIVEVAEHVFGPAAGAVLSDWGAEVVKIEPVERGDASRGLGSATSVNILFESANRGKRSIGVDLASPEGRDILYRLVKDADVFLTNKLPAVRQKLQIDLEHIRAHNPNIIYVRGGGLGERGDEADRGSYDLLAFWHRSGASAASASPEGFVPFLPAPGFGDFTGAMFIAGGVMGALYHRAMTGEATVVDASLLATGIWSMGAAIASADNNPAWSWPPPSLNPLSWIYRTRDGRHIALCCLQAGHYWPILCDLLDRPDLKTDPRFQSHADILANDKAAIALLAPIFAGRNLAEWKRLFAGFSGQWGVVQTAADAAIDPQVEPNRFIQQVEAASGVPFRLVSAPIQFDGEPGKIRRAPEFNEHGDTILTELGLSWNEIVELKVKGAVA